jgi:hypothetical protein
MQAAPPALHSPNVPSETCRMPPPQTPAHRRGPLRQRNSTLIAYVYSSTHPDADVRHPCRRGLLRRRPLAAAGLRLRDRRGLLVHPAASAAVGELRSKPCVHLVKTF